MIEDTNSAATYLIELKSQAWIWNASASSVLYNWWNNVLLVGYAAEQ